MLVGGYPFGYNVYADATFEDDFRLLWKKVCKKEKVWTQQKPKAVTIKKCKGK